MRTSSNSVEAVLRQPQKPSQSDLKQGVIFSKRFFHVKPGVSNFIIIYSTNPLQKLGSPYLGMATATARAELPTATSVCSIFVSKQWNDCQCLVFLTCMQDTEACDCTCGLYKHCMTRSLWESALDWSLRKKSFATLWNQTSISNVPGFSVWCFTSWAIPPPMRGKVSEKVGFCFVLYREVVALVTD